MPENSRLSDERRVFVLRAARCVAWGAATLAFVFAVSAVVLVRLNGDGIFADDTLGAAILAVSFASVGAVVSARRPRNPIGWLLLAGGFFASLDAFSAEYPAYALGAEGFGPSPLLFAWMSTWVFAPGLAALSMTLLLFPKGRPPSRGWRFAAWVIAFALFLMVVPMAVGAWGVGEDLVGAHPWNDGVVGGRYAALQNAGVALGMGSVLLSVASIAWRFRRAASEERQQIKYLVLAGASTFAVFIAASPAAPFELPEPLASIMSHLAPIALPSIPAAVGVAILRHRLFDIDFVINKTLVYGALTGALAAVYLAGVASSQYLLRFLAGEDSRITIVASTLAIAALFGPLRSRIQTFVDSRFYREKYDAAKTLEQFSAKLRDETSLDSLSENLTTVVEDTLRPSHSSLWLRPDREKISESPKKTSP